MRTAKFYGVSDPDGNSLCDCQSYLQQQILREKKFLFRRHFDRETTVKINANKPEGNL